MKLHSVTSERDILLADQEELDNFMRSLYNRRLAKIRKTINRAKHSKVGKKSNKRVTQSRESFLGRHVRRS